MDKILREQLEQILNEIDPTLVTIPAAVAIGWGIGRTITRISCRSKYKNDPKMYKKCMSYRYTPAGGVAAAGKALVTGKGKKAAGKEFTKTWTDFDKKKKKQGKK